MNDGSDPRLVKHCGVFASASAAFAVLAGLLAIAGWKLHIAALCTWALTPVRIVPNAAACLVLLGISLWWQRNEDYRTFARARKFAAQTAAGMVCLVALLSLAEHAFGWQLGVDHLLHTVPAAEAIPGVRPGLMATIAGWVFVDLGVALLVLDWKTRQGQWLAQFLSMGAGIGAIFGIFALVLQPTASGITMALPAAVTFFVLACGILASRPTWAAGGLLASQSAGATLLRRTIPIVLLVLGLIGWAVAKALLTTIHFTWMEASLLAIVCIALLFGVVTWVAFIVDRSDALNVKLERRVAERTVALRDSEERLAGIIQSALDAIVTVDEQHRIVLFNAAAELMFGCPAKDVVGQPLERFIPQRIRAAHAGHIQGFGNSNVTNRGMGLRDELRAVRSNGEEFPMEASISQVNTAGEKLFTVILRDITERKQAEEALREKSKILALAPVSICNLENRIVVWNGGAEKMFGFSGSEAIGQLAHELLHTEFPEALGPILAQLRSAGSWEGELTHRKRNGERIVVLSLWALHRNQDGEPTRILKVSSNMTDRKKSENQLAMQAEELAQQAGELARSRQELEKQTLTLQSVLDSLDEGLVAADEQGKFILWNAAASKIVGLGPSNMRVQDWSKYYGLFLPDAVTPFPPAQDPLARALRGEACTVEGFINNSALGAGVWVECNAAPLRDKQGVVQGGVVALRDVTESRANQRQIENLNRDLEQRVRERTAELEVAYQDLADQKFALDQHAIVAMTDDQGTITYVNDRFCAISQYSREDLMGQNHRMIKSGFHPPEFFEQMYSTIKRGEVWHGEMKNRAQDGSMFWLDTTIVPFMGADGKPWQYAAIRTDITERKRGEERLLQRTAELEAANQELEAFTYSVSHDLRAPLRHMAGFSTLLLEECGAALDGHAQHYVQRIQEGTRKMDQLVDGLLNLARISRQSTHLQAVQLNALLDEVIALLKPEWEGRAVDWKIALLPPIECDPVLMKQVFQNLLSNALKYSRPRQPALIEVGTSGVGAEGGTAIFVRDNGVGFNMKYAEKLFGVFQRLHRAEEFEGSGVGLTIVQRIINKHGGRIWVEAELDKGATFYFTLGSSLHGETKSSAVSTGQ